MNALQQQITMEGIATPAPRAIAIERYAPLAVWGIVTITLLLISFRIIAYGFLPGGDARRHVAKAFTDRPYSEIIVMRPEYTMDHSPGWEWLLRQLHRVAGWDSDALMSFSIVATLLCVFFAPLPWLKRPEAWLAALMAQMLAIPEIMNRLTQARPYLLTEAILIAILFAWSTENGEKHSRLKIVLTCLGIALSVWMHGAWYLWVLPLAGFFIAGARRTGLWLTACWIIGTIGGALLTGKPMQFLEQAVRIAWIISKEQIPQWIMVGEFQPSSGEFPTLVLVLLVCIWRYQHNKTAKSLLRGPVFWLMVVCWILGFKADRFWADWGVPAVLVWLSLAFQEMMTTTWPATSWKRVMAVGLLAAPLFFQATNDLGRRYTACLDDIFMDAHQLERQGWTPEPKSIFYSDDMAFFYNTLYKNPRAEWRYILGMEPALMPEADLQVLRRIQMSHGSVKAFEPWVEKMRPGDRLEIYCSAQPNLPKLEWTNVEDRVWIGRLPRSR